MMQVIAGVHFNYSVPEAFWPAYQALEQDEREPRDFISTAYFGMIRNLQRYGWLVPYLFGASPAVCTSFLGELEVKLPKLDPHTYYEPFATSLRMGDIGYQNSREDAAGVKASYDSLDAYVDSLTRAIETPHPEYEKMGVVVNGVYEQLNANLLQIENEYYSTIRPKQILEPLEKPSLALKRRGVQYVELRSLDVNAFDPLGINEEQLRFLESFLLFCLLTDSPVISASERREIDHNQSAAAHRGRDPNLKLSRQGRDILLRDWARELLGAMEGVSEILEAGHPERGYGASLRQQLEAARDPECTPSARMLREMGETGEGFHAFAKRMSLKHQHYFKSLPEDPRVTARFEAQARESLQALRELEDRPQAPFGEFLAEYFAQR
jgi:glutamate--cysteine ligase